MPLPGGGRMDAHKAFRNPRSGSFLDDPVPQLVLPRRVLGGIEIRHDEKPGLGIMGDEPRHGIGADGRGELEPFPFEGVARDRGLPKLGHSQTRQRALETIAVCASFDPPNVGRDAARQRLATAGLAVRHDGHPPHGRANRLRRERTISAIGLEYDLSHFDHETCRLEPLENSFGPKSYRCLRNKP